MRRSYTECDICGQQIGSRDLFFKIKPPSRFARIYYGCSEFGYRRFDLCDECGAKAQNGIRSLVQKKRVEGKEFE